MATPITATEIYDRITLKPVVSTGRIDPTVTNPSILLLGAAAQKFPWKGLTISVFDASDLPVTSATGVVTGYSIRTGQGVRRAFDTTVDLATDAWAWDPELASVREFQFEVAGLNAGYTYEVTCTSVEN